MEDRGSGGKLLPATEGKAKQKISVQHSKFPSFCSLSALCLSHALSAHIIFTAAAGVWKACEETNKREAIRIQAGFFFQ